MGGRKRRDHRTVWCLLCVGYRLASSVSLRLNYLRTIRQESRWARGQNSGCYCCVFANWITILAIMKHKVWFFVYCWRKKERSRISCWKTTLSLRAISPSAKKNYCNVFTNSINYTCGQIPLESFKDLNQMTDLWSLNDPERRYVLAFSPVLQWYDRVKPSLHSSFDLWHCCTVHSV